MPDGGVIRIYAGCTDVEFGNIYDLSPGRFVKIEVEDHGKGIPENIIGRIFDPYFTTKTQGCGLGLASSYSIIQKHDGCISVESVPGKGSLFTILLPAVEPESAGIGVSCGGNSRRTVVFIDDDESIGMLAEKMLAQLGFSPRIFIRQQDACSYIRTEKANGREVFALIFDISLPDSESISGFVQEMFSISPSLNIVASSGTFPDSACADCSWYGFNAVMHKPYRIEDMSAVLSSLKCR
ncbi:MAG: ATP-binding protein [Spirochaetota bacterium]